MNTFKSLILTAAVAAAATLPALAYQPVEVNVPVSTALTWVTNNATVYTNNGALFQPQQPPADCRCVLNVTGQWTNSITLGFNEANDPPGTNLSTSLPLLVTFQPITNGFGAQQCYTAYVPGTNWTDVTKARLDYATCTAPGLSINSVKFEWLW